MSDHTLESLLKMPLEDLEKLAAKPRVSFVMPCYNAVAWVGEAIQSVLMQTIKEIELIVVDDCSTDGTSEFLDDWAAKFPNVKVFHNENNMGAGWSRNFGTLQASAPIIAITDGDDLNADERAALILRHFELNPESELVTFPVMQIGYYNERMEENPGEPFDHERFLATGEVSYYSNPSSAAKKDSLIAMGGFGHEDVTSDKRQSDDFIFLHNWVKSGRKVDYQAGAYTVFHRTLPNSMMAKIRGFRPEWGSKQ